MDLVKRPSPDTWELKRRRTELARLERELAEQEAALVTFKAELAAFRTRYFQALARPYAELDEMEAQVAEKASRLRPKDAGKRRKAEKARERADESAGKHRPVAVPAPETAARVKAPDELRKIYRDLTKLAHPDLTTDPEEKRHREAVMIQANAAYAEGDGETLRYLLESWELETAEPDPDDVTGELERVMRQIAQAEQRLAAPKQALAELEASELAKLMRRAQLAERQGRDLIERFVEEIEEAKKQARKRLKALERRLAKAARGEDAGGDEED